MKSKGKRFGFLWFWSLVCIVFLVYPYFIFSAIGEPNSHEGRAVKNTLSDLNEQQHAMRRPASKPDEQETSESNDDSTETVKQHVVSPRPKPLGEMLTLGDVPPFAWRHMQSDRTNGRVDLLEVDNLCFNEHNQPYAYEYKDNIPKVQIRASDRSLDRYLEILRGPMKNQSGVSIEYIADRTLFVVGGVWHYHLSHFFINNYMPLINLLNNYFETPDWMDIPRDLSFDAGEGEVFDTNFNSLHFTKIVNRQGSSRAKIVCYKKAVIGLNSTCSCCGCHNKYYPAKSPVYRQTREFVYSHFLKRGLPKYAFELPIDVKIIQRGSTRKIMNVENMEHYITNDLGLKCTVVNTEKGTSFADQINLMSETTILIASHGNALGNAFWLPDHSAVIEVQSFGQKGNQWFPISYSRGNHSHPLYYHNISCYDEFTSTSKCRINADAQPSANFNVDIELLGKYIKGYVEYHKKMSKLDKESWDALPMDTTLYIEGH
jgi:hypothetical protein